MVTTSPLQTRPRWQWEIDSTSSPPPDPGNAPYNCGPCSIAKIGEFYLEKPLNVNAIRRSSGARDLQPTNVSQQKIMLEKLGIPCAIMAMSISQLTSILGTGRRPVLIGLDMSRVPLSVAGHPFRGAHAVVALCNATRNGVAGKLIMDPNFSPRTGRTDPTGGARFYSDNLIAYAMSSSLTQRWGVVPSRPKTITAPAPEPAPTTPTITAGGLPVSFTSRSGWTAKIKAGKPRRSGASLSSSSYGATSGEEPFPIWGEVKGQDLAPYGLPGGTRWFFGPQYISSRWRVVYIPYADLTDRSF